MPQAYFAAAAAAAAGAGVGAMPGMPGMPGAPMMLGGQPPKQAAKRRRRAASEPGLPDESKPRSKYRGVSWHRRDSRWLSRTWVKGRLEHLGTFRSEKMAALAVDLRFLDTGNDKNLNFPDPAEREALIAKFKASGEFKLRPREALENPIPRSGRRRQRASGSDEASALKRKWDDN